MALEEFLSSFEDAIKRLLQTKAVVKVVSHIDCDGICSASILCAALKRQNIEFSISVIKQITREFLTELKHESFELVIFSDLGSSNKDWILEVLQDRQIIILDHHQIKKGAAQNLIEVNPLLYGIDGSREISGAGVCYIFCKLLDTRNEDLAHLALIGAIGDMQEYSGFIGLNSAILEDAKNKIKVSFGLRIFGAQTRPLYKVIEYSTEMYIPGVTGSEIGAIKFLEDLGISVKIKDKPKKLADLNKDELKRLMEAIIVQRSSQSSTPQDVIGPVYVLEGEQDGGPTKDIKEFSTLLNACGRLGRPTLGIGVCLGDIEAKKEAFLLLENYKIEILNCLNWFYDARKNNKIVEKENFVLINAEEYVKDTLIGVLASILSRSGVFDEGKIIIAMAHTVYDSTKISSRIVGRLNTDVNYVNLKAILEEICTNILGQVGGHEHAAGALIPQDKDEEFISKVYEYFSKSRLTQKNLLGKA